VVSIYLVLACVPHLIYNEEVTELLKARASTNTSVLSDEITTVVKPFLPAWYACSHSIVSASSCVDPSSSDSSEPSDDVISGAPNGSFR